MKYKIGDIVNIKPLESKTIGIIIRCNTISLRSNQYLVRMPKSSASLVTLLSHSKTLSSRQYWIDEEYISLSIESLRDNKIREVLYGKVVVELSKRLLRV